jgi:hypothetical protein
MRLSEAKFDSILEELTPNNISCITGHPGMHWWKTQVMGTLGLNLNWNYNRSHEMVYNKTIRQMPANGVKDENDQYTLQTRKDNVRLFTPTIVDQLNQMVVAAGHLLQKKDVGIKGRCDSFVTELQVHFPTDISLLFNTVRKVVLLTDSLSDALCFSLCRQSFSIFQEHTEWMIKRKARVPEELCLQVCIMEDQYGFILHHNVMKKETDDQVVRMVEETQAQFTHFNGCRFDKRFNFPANQIEL